MATNGKTVHSDSCKGAFGKRDMSCPRCVELANGAAPRAGWGARNKAIEAQRIQAIRAHDFTECARLHVVCTHFDW